MVREAIGVAMGDQTVSKVIACRGGDIYLLDLGNGKGQIADTRRGNLFPAKNNRRDPRSRLPRGYLAAIERHATRGRGRRAGSGDPDPERVVGSPREPYVNGFPRATVRTCLGDVETQPLSQEPLS